MDFEKTMSWKQYTSDPYLIDQKGIFSLGLQSNSSGDCFGHLAQLEQTSRELKREQEVHVATQKKLNLHVSKSDEIKRNLADNIKKLEKSNEKLKHALRRQFRESERTKGSIAVVEKPSSEETELELKQSELNEIVLSLINEEDEHAETQKQLFVRSQIFNRQEEKLMD